MIIIIIMAAIKVISFNCHGFNISAASYLQTTAYDADILLQETWLCNATSFRLNDALKEYIVYHTSSMEDKFVTGVYTGRPFGGTAVLVHKKLCSYSCRVVTDNSRLTAVRCQLKADNYIIIGSVYVPFNDNSRQNHDDCLSVVGVMQGDK